VGRYEAAQSTVVAFLEDICKITKGDCIVLVDAVVKDGINVES